MTIIRIQNPLSPFFLRKHKHDFVSAERIFVSMRGGGYSMIVQSVHRFLSLFLLMTRWCCCSWSRSSRSLKPGLSRDPGDVLIKMNHFKGIFERVTIAMSEEIFQILVVESCNLLIPVVDGSMIRYFLDSGHDCFNDFTVDLNEHTGFLFDV